MIIDDSIYVLSMNPHVGGFEITCFAEGLSSCPVTAAENYIEGYYHGVRDYGVEGQPMMLHLSGKQLKELSQTLVDLDAGERLIRTLGGGKSS